MDKNEAAKYTRHKDHSLSRRQVLIKAQHQRLGLLQVISLVTGRRLHALAVLWEVNQRLHLQPAHLI